MKHPIKHTYGNIIDDGNEMNEDHTLCIKFVTWPEYLTAIKLWGA